MLTKSLKDIDRSKIKTRTREEMVERFRVFNQQEQQMKAEFRQKGLPEPTVLA
ncbi:hypothetical protein [Pseudomonas sp. stari2]|uniref:hypothetical protein n=1 Tax=Pseudomonas sp. Stari2 TaxID=2954814 RepID=UPI00345C6B46